MSQEITVLAVFVAKPGEEAALKTLLQGIVGPTLKEDGALQYDLHQDTKESRRFVFYERWASAAALDTHGETPHIKHLKEALPALIEFGQIDRIVKL